MKDEKGQKRDDFLLADVLGVSFQEEQTKYVANVNKKRLWGGASISLEPSDHPLARSVGKELVGIAGGCIRVAGPAEEVFRLRPPLFARLFQGSLLRVGSPARGDLGRLKRCHLFPLW